MTDLFYHLTLKSTNGKTGPIPVSTTSKKSCWAGCPLMHTACYAERGPMAIFWEQLTQGNKGTAFAGFLASVSALPAAQLWRHNQAGDLPGIGAVIDAGELTRLVAANLGKRGFTYTHKPVLGEGESVAANRDAIGAANADGFTINLSGNNVGHADELAALEIAPVVTVLPEEYGRKTKGKEWAETLEAYRERVADLPKKTPAGRALSVCPATFLDTNCAACGLCQRQSRKSVVGFPAHGAAKRKADAIAKGAAA